jgi:hypothetical protein
MTDDELRLLRDADARYLTTERRLEYVMSQYVLMRREGSDLFALEIERAWLECPVAFIERARLNKVPLADLEILWQAQRRLPE